MSPSGLAVFLQARQQQAELAQQEWLQMQQAAQQAQMAAASASAAQQAGSSQDEDEEDDMWSRDTVITCSNPSLEQWWHTNLPVLSSGETWDMFHCWYRQWNTGNAHLEWTVEIVVKEDFKIATRSENNLDWDAETQYMTFLIKLIFPFFQIAFV